MNDRHLDEPSKLNVKWHSDCYKSLVNSNSERINLRVDKKNQLDVTFCILYFSSNSCSTCFGEPCAHRQELTTA
jgi:hypothetical protein